MRPLRLTLEGFTCFKERQEPLDLEGLDLFAISGPTGSGKSSLLDAMIFALFGKVPRLRQGLSELISLGASRAAVSLDFRLAEREFRVFRALHRGRSTSAQLEERVDGMYSSLSDGVRQTDRQVQALLGLDYDTFVRAVILPQGDFAAFLKSPASKQREILRKLLRLDIYEDMRAMARRRGQRLEARLEEVERRFTEDYAAATAERLDELRQQMTIVRERLEEDAAALVVARQGLESARQRRRQSDELEVKSSRRRELETQMPSRQAAARRLQEAQRALPLVPLLDRWRDETERRQQLLQAAESAEIAWRAARGAHRQAREGMAESEARGEEMAALQAEGQRLDRWLEWIEPRQKVLHDLETLAAQHIAKWAKLQALEHQGEAAAGRRQTAADDLAGSQEELQELGYDAELEQRLDAVRDTALRLQHLRQEMTKLAAQEETARLALDEVTASQAAAAQAVEAAQATQLRCQGGHQAAQAALQHAEQAHQASILRHGLEPGAPCPVCEQSIVELPQPSAEAHHSLTPLRARCDATAQELEAATGRLAVAERRLAEMDAAAVERRESRRRSTARASAMAEEVGRLAADLQIALADDLEGDPKATIEERVLQAAEGMAERRQRFREINEQVHRQQHRLQEVDRQRERLDDEAQVLRELLKELDRRLQAAQRQLEAMQERFPEVSSEEDPEELRRQVEARLAALQRAQRSAADTERRSAVELAAAEQQHRQTEEASQQAEAQLEALQTEVQRSLDEAGFQSPEAVRDAVVDETTRAELETDQRRYEREVESLDQRLKELQDSLGGTPMSARELASQESEVERLEEVERQGRDALARLGVSLADVERRHRRRGELSSELVDVRRDLRAYQELQRELAGQRFQAFLLEKVFDDLVRGATQRLLILSQQRYELAFEEGTFVVVDHDNASQRRSADTLSGGETFLASLALALELCEQVQREAGAITVESLFIDEGFGTLDPETLETVAGAIEALPHGGRMVGIITHLPELTERLPWRVMVSKHPEGSRYRVEEG